MKKKYISPETLVIDIHFNHALLAGSIKDTLGNGKKDGPDYSRSFNTFDEEDEEDEEY